MAINRTLPKGIRKGRRGSGFEARYGNKYIGTFKDIESAVAAYEVKKKEAFPERLGLPAGILVDEKLLPQIEAHKWTISGRYARAVIDGKETRLHRYVVNLIGLSVPDGWVVDHVNHDTMDNRCDNLRLLPHSSNILNQKRMSIRRNGSRWMAAIKRNYKQKSRSFVFKCCAETWIKIQRNIAFREALNANQ